MRRPSQLRRTVATLAVVAAMLGLSGCFKASQDVKVRADGTGSVTLHAELNKRALEAILKSFGDLGALAGATPNMGAPFRSVDRTFPDGTKVRTVDNADRATLDASFDFSGPDDYKRKLQQVNEAVAANPDAALPDDGSIEIRRLSDRMDVALDLGSFSAGDLDFAPLIGLVDQDALPEVVATITMPGKVLASNGGGKVQGRTVTWDLLARGSPSTLTASSEVAAPGAPAWTVPLGVGLIFLVLLVAVTFLISQRRHAARVGGPSGPDQPGEWPPAEPPGTGTFFPPRPPAAPAGWPTPPPPPPVQPAPQTGPPPWLPSPWSTPPAAPTVAAPAAQAPPSAAAPTAEMASAAPVPGWYRDPAGGNGLRYWDGGRWTEHTC